jgi:hypothetical protein
MPFLFGWLGCGVGLGLGCTGGCGAGPVGGFLIKLSNILPNPAALVAGTHSNIKNTKYNLFIYVFNLSF